MALLEVHNLTMRFGGITAVNRVDLAVDTGEIFSIIGPNGAGKTTVFNAITGIYEPSAGTIRVNGRNQGRPFTWKALLACVVVGLLTGITAVVATVNPDRLWRASVKRNVTTSDRSFPWAKALD